MPSLQDIVVNYSPVFHIIIDNALGPDRNRGIYEEIVSLKNHFEPAQIGKGAVHKKIRSSTVCKIDELYQEEIPRVTTRKRIHLLGELVVLKSLILKTFDRFTQSEFMRGLMENASFPPLQVSRHECLGDPNQKIRKRFSVLRSA